MAKTATPKMTREEIRTTAREMAQDLASDLVNKIMAAHDALTPDELAKVEADPFCATPYFVVRSLAMAVGADVLSNRFEAEATKPHTKRIKATLARRYWD